MADYDLGTARGKIQLDYDGAKGVAAAERDVSSLGGRLSKGVGPALGKIGLGFSAIGVAAVAGIGLAVKSAADFDSVMSGTAAVTGATATQMQTLRDKALQLGKDTSFSASEAATAIQELAKAGLSVPDIMNGAADATVALAAAGEIALPEAATIASNAMNQFGLTAQQLPHIADLFAGAANASSIGVSDLGQSMSYVGPVAKAMGVSIEDTTTAIALFGNQGIVGSSAGTALRGILAQLSPTTKRAADEFKKLGIITKDGRNQFFDATGKLKPLNEVVGILHKSMAGMSAQERATFTSRAFGREDMAAVNILAGQTSGSFDKLGNAIGKVKAADVAKERLNNLKGSMQQLTGSIETAMIGIGEILIPILKRIVDAITGLVNKFLNLSPATQKIIVIIAIVAGIFIGLVGVVLLVVAGFAALASALAPLLAVVGVSIGAFLAFIAVNVLIAAAVIALVIIIILNFGRIKAFIIAVFSAVASFLVGIWNTIYAAVSGAVGSVVSFIASAWGGLTSLVASLWNGIFAAVSGVVRRVVAEVQAVWGGLVGIVGGIFRGIAAVISIVSSTISAVVGFVFQAIVSAVTGPINLIVSVVRLGWNLVYQIVRLALALLLLFVAVQFAAIRFVITTIMNAVLSVITTVWNAIRVPVMAAIAIIRSTVTAGFNFIRAVVVTVMNVIHAAISAAWNAISAVVSAAVSRVRSIVLAGFNAARAVVSAVMAAIRAVVSSAWSAVSAVVSGGVARVLSFVRGLAALGGMVAGFFGSMISAAAGKVGGLISVVAGIGGRAISAAAGFGRALYGAGQSLVQGAINGVKSLIGSLAATVSRMASSAVKAATSILHIGSPSRVFYDIGRDTAEGMRLGIDAHIPAVNATVMALATNVISSGTPTIAPASAGGGGTGAGVSLSFTFGNLYGMTPTEVSSAVSSSDVIDAIVGAVQAGRRG